MPIVPQLMRDVGQTQHLGWLFGAFTGLYALMQCLFSPLLALLSDRIGRRPVLLLSLTGAVLDYLFMAVAPTLGWLFLGRAIAGISGANMAVTSAYIADVTPEDQRSRRFGQLGACVGVGFILGPVIGGLLGAWWVRAPFLAAALMNLVALLLTAMLVRPAPRQALPAAEQAPLTLNPLAGLSWATRSGAPLRLIAVSGLLVLVSEISGTIWVLYGEDKFAWDPTMIGLSLACFGVFHALAQAFIVAPLTARLGTRGTLLAAILADSAAYIGIGLSSHGWIAFALMPLFSLGGVGAPALQAMLSNSVAPNQQGRLQGLLASVASIATVIAPVAISAIYFMSRHRFPGLAWMIGAALYLLCLPAVIRRPPAGDTNAGVN